MGDEAKDLADELETLAHGIAAGHYTQGEGAKGAIMTIQRAASRLRSEPERGDEAYATGVTHGSYQQDNRWIEALTAVIDDHETICEVTKRAIGGCRPDEPAEGERPDLKGAAMHLRYCEFAGTSLEHRCVECQEAVEAFADPEPAEGERETIPVTLEARYVGKKRPTIREQTFVDGADPEPSGDAEPGERDDLTPHEDEWEGWPDDHAHHGPRCNPDDVPEDVILGFISQEDAQMWAGGMGWPAEVKSWVKKEDDPNPYPVMVVPQHDPDRIRVYGGGSPPGECESNARNLPKTPGTPKDPTTPTDRDFSETCGWLDERGYVVVSKSEWAHLLKANGVDEEDWQEDTQRAHLERRPHQPAGEPVVADPRSWYMNLRTCVCGEDASEHLSGTRLPGDVPCTGFDPDWEHLYEDLQALSRPTSSPPPAGEVVAREPEAWKVQHGDYVELWTDRRFENAVRQVESLREAHPDDEVTLTPLVPVEIRRTEEE